MLGGFASVEIQASDGPRDWWMGVVTPQAHPMFFVIEERLSKELGEGKQDVGFPWYRYFEGKWRDWKLPDWRQPWAILELGKGGKGEYSNYLHEGLVEISCALDTVLRSRGAEGG